MWIKKPLQVIFLLFMVAFIGSCGGGSGISQQSENGSSIQTADLVQSQPESQNEQTETATVSISQSQSESQTEETTDNTQNRTVVIEGDVPDEIQIGESADTRGLAPVLDVGAVCGETYVDGYFTNNGTKFQVPSIPVNQECMIVFLNRKIGGSNYSDATIIVVTDPFKANEAGKFSVKVLGIVNGVARIESEGNSLDINTSVALSQFVGKTLKIVLSPSEIQDVAPVPSSTYVPSYVQTTVEKAVEYDSAGRVVREDLGDGRYIEYVYDENGNLLEINSN
jgi:YD repeat-containing protein